MNSERQKDKEDKSTGNETDCGKWGGRGGRIPHGRIFIKLNAERICVPLWFMTAMVPDNE